jgi:hypothetical protein
MGKTPQQDRLLTGRFDDLIAQVSPEWRERFRAFFELGQDPGCELLAYLEEQEALPKTSGGVVFNALNQAFSRTFERWYTLGRALNPEEEKPAA